MYKGSNTGKHANTFLEIVKKVVKWLNGSGPSCWDPQCCPKQSEDYFVKYHVIVGQLVLK